MGHPRDDRVALVFAWIDHNIAASKTTSVAYAEHPPILEAIERQDVDEARAAMERHMRGATKRLLSRLDVGTQAPDELRMSKG